MSINEIFVKDFGKRVLEFIQGKTKNVAEIRLIQESFVRNVTRILETPIIHNIIEEAKVNVAECTAQQLRTEITDREKRLFEIEAELRAKRTSTSHVTQSTQNTQENSENLNSTLFDDREDEMFSQVIDAEQIISAPQKSEDDLSQ